MTTISDVTSSPPLPGTGSTQGRTSTAATDGNAQTGSTTGAGAATTATTSGAGPASTSSTVTTISTISTQLQAVQAASGSDEVYSTSKVNEIKAAIVAGTFKVNSAKVADGLLDSVHDLLGSRQRNQQ